jgi:hypothetical protein
MAKSTKLSDAATPSAQTAPTTWTARVTPHVELGNKALQILAIIVAGIWAGWTWLQTTAPGLGTGITTSAEVKTPWNPLVNSCDVEILLSVENIGSRNVTVARTHYEITKAPRPALSSTETFKVVNYPPSGAKTLIEGTLTPAATLSHVYPPKGKSSQTFNFLLSADEPEEVWFSFEFLDESGSRLGDQYGAIETCKRDNGDVPTKSK